LFLIVGAAAFWITVTKLLVPFFLGEGGTENYQYLAWLPFGPSLQDNWKVFLQNPLGFLALFFDKQRMMYYFQLLGPTGFLALFSPAHYALFLLPAGMFVLGSFGHLGLLNIMAQYSAHTVPAIFIAAISGLAFLRKELFVKFPGNKERVVLILSLYIVFCAAGFYGKTSGHRISKFIKAGRENGAPEISSALDKYIPKDASVTSTINLSAHLSHRQKLYLLEEMQADTNYPQWENVRVSGTPLPENPLISRKRYESDYIVAHKKFSGDKFPVVVEKILKHGYREIYRDNSGGAVIFKK